MIRQFLPSDAPACCALIHACLENDRSLTPALRKKMQPAETPESIKERSRLYYLAVCELAGQIVGMVGLDMNEIRILCVAPEHQRRGIGRELLDHIQPMVPGTLFSDIFVYASVQAAGFYRKCGFVEKGPFALDVGGLVLPTVFLTFSIQT